MNRLLITVSMIAVAYSNAMAEDLPTKLPAGAVPPPPGVEIPKQPAAPAAAAAVPPPPLPGAKVAPATAAPAAEGDMSFTMKPEEVDKALDEVKEAPKPKVVPPTDFDYVAGGSLVNDTDIDEAEKKPAKKGKKAARGKEAQVWDTLTPAMNNDLFNALNRNDVKAINAYFSSMKVDPNLMGVSGETLLTNAIRVGNSKLVDFLITRGADVNLSNNVGLSPLHLAIMRGDSIILEKIFGEDVNAEAIDSSGATPLMYAARYGSDDAMVRLLEKNVRIDAEDLTGKTALHYAAFSGSLPIITVLINRGADINATDANGHTPLMIAASAKNLASVQALLERGADPSIVDKFGADASVIALRVGDYGIASYIGGAQAKSASAPSFQQPM